MAINYRGKQLTAREQAAQVRRWTGWSAQEYRRQYKALYARVISYEQGTGLPRGSVNVADLLANNARNRYYAQYHGEEYRPSNLYQAVQAAPAISSSQRLSATARARVQSAAISAIERQVHGLIEHSIFGEVIQNLIANARRGAISIEELNKQMRRFGEVSRALRATGEARNRAAQNIEDIRPPQS